MKNKLKAILFAGVLVLAGTVTGSMTAKAETPEILYSGKDGRIEWSIDENGHLLLTGDGDRDEVDAVYSAPDWTGVEYCAKIKTATVKVTNMTSARRMFFECSNMTSVEFEGFDTGNIEDMSDMFKYCYSLESLDVSQFNTSKVQDMGFMFWGCEKLEELDVSGFDTGNVKNMVLMFADCSSLESLEVSKFKTGNVTDMTGMFSNCSNLTNLDVSGFDTSKVEDMGGMFSDCEGLTSLDLKNFETTNVKNMRSMFRNCKKMTELDLSKWDLSSIQYTDFMLHGMKSLIKLTLPNSPVEIELSGDFYDDKGILTQTAKENSGEVTYFSKDYADTHCIKIGHTYSVPIFTWAEDYSYAKVYMECTRDDCIYDIKDKKLYLDAVVTKTVVNPTSEKEGVVIHTATVVVGGKTYTDVKRVSIPKLSQQHSSKEPLSKPIGTSFHTSGIFYRVIKTGKTPELAYMGPKNKKVKKVTIPATVKIEGVTYRITSVGDGALKNYKYLTKVTIGKNVTKIGKNAFYGCKKLNKIVIKSKKLKSVGKNALKGINKKARIDVPNSKRKAYKKLFKSRTGYKKTMSVK